MSKRVFSIIAVLLSMANSASAQNKEEPPKASLALEDQFERKHDLADYRGNVVILLYGDKAGSTANKGLGQKLHVQFHPTAQGRTPAEAARAPVTPLKGLAEGAVSPDVAVIPVACIGKVPDLVKGIIRRQFKNEAELPVWLDFEGKMKSQFGMKAGEPNVILVDGAGRVRMKISGELDAGSYERLVRAAEYLRKEIAGVK